MTLRPTMVQLSDDDRTLLAEGAAHAGISRSELVRRALRAYLAGRAEARASRLIRSGYERMPETAHEDDVALAGARRMLTDPDLEW